ncbi:hypothetical protein N7509_000154 [Penicillium cosmopolitanum]|uniref:ABM domain-containing protein n=1 Tax=Penicillium cosmopolitanum TaxID=1131564 RepID=A0A9W9WC55_9EURO|nr:uncharacterized protein N7509_000154 [Penicillium cosmopolitanum]KAJ5414820.1 hypothetical protein N7509_000154 [Penicillium cosmopolitanum]
MSSEPIHNIVTLTPRDDKVVDLINAFGKFSQYVQAHEPETLVYYAVQTIDKSQLVIIEKYSNEAALKAHAQSEAFKEFGKAISGTLQAPPDISTSTFSSGFEARARI